MGAEQSLTSAERRTRAEIENAIAKQMRAQEQRAQAQSRIESTVHLTVNRDAASKRDLEAALENQRKVYEEKIKTLLENQDKTATTSTASQETEATLKRQLDKALQEQRELYEIKMRNLLENQCATSTVNVQQVAAQQVAMQQVMQQAAMQQVAAQQAAAQQAAAQQAFLQQQHAQQLAAQNAAAQKAAAQQAAAQQTAAQQAFLQQQHAQQLAAQNAAAQKAAAQKAAAEKAAAQKAAAEKAAAQKAAAQKAACEKVAAHIAAAENAAAAQEAARKNALQQAATQKFAEFKAKKAIEREAAQKTAATKSKVEGIVTESLERVRSPYAMTRSDLRETLDFAINQLYPQLKEMSTRTPSPGPSAANKNDGNIKGNQHIQKGFKSEEDDISCPTCGGRYGDRIFKCQQDHSACHRCRERQGRCASCHGQILGTRNFDLEKYVAERRVKCPNADAGCRLQLKLSALEAHGKECPFKEMPCPSLEPCAWNGKLPLLSGHFDKSHPSHRQGDVDKELFLPNISTDSHTLHLVKLGNFNFLVHIKVSIPKEKIYFAVLLVGTKSSAAKWAYEMHVYNKREPRRKYQYIDSCKSNKDSLDDVLNKGQCAVLPLQYANTFFNEGVLAYKFYIKREEVEKEAKSEDGEGKKHVGSRRGGRGGARGGGRGGRGAKQA